MLGIFKRWRLVWKGLSSGKRRRHVEESDFVAALETGWPMRAALLAAFVFGLSALIFTGQQEEPAKKFLLCLLIFATAIAQLWINHRRHFLKIPVFALCWAR
jgi:hypothetical protein